MSIQNTAFTWCDPECGHFREDFFPPINIPTILHKPWVEWNILIPPGIYEEVCHLIKIKLNMGVYEPFNPSYCLCWFCIVKKDGKSLCILHSLEPLNHVTIKHAGVTPFTDQISKHFTGCTCSGMLDLYVGYNKCGLAKLSHDLTTFQSPFGALRLITLLMGWTNSVPIFYDDVAYILQPEIPDTTVPYIDDVPICSPETCYVLANRTKECIPANPGICHFMWEHFQSLNCVVQHIKYYAAPSAVPS